MKKITIILICLLLMLSFSSCAEEKTDLTKPVYTVNGEEITLAEFEYFKTKFKAQILNDYLEKYDFEYTEDFWTTEFDGKTPQTVLDEKALKESSLAKIQLVLMREEGIYEDISFEGLKLKAETFNRENETKEGLVGLKSIQMSQFYTYYIENGIMELKNIYIEGKLKPTDGEIKKETEKVRNELSGEERAYEDDEIVRIALGRLEETKYDIHIEELYNKAEIKKVENDG